MRKNLIHLIVSMTGLAPDYPSKNIRMIYPWGAGRGTDAYYFVYGRYCLCIGQIGFSNSIIPFRIYT